MGAAASAFGEEPIFQKHDEKGQNERIRFCHSEMQGWRGNMEDAHIANLDIGDGISLFGVFDGHGGPEVAKFVKIHFTNCLTNSPAFKRRDYKLALQYTFLKMDRLLLSQKGNLELKSLMEKH